MEANEIRKISKKEFNRAYSYKPSWLCKSHCVLFLIL